MTIFNFKSSIRSHSFVVWTPLTSQLKHQTQTHTHREKESETVIESYGRKGNARATRREIKRRRNNKCRYINESQYTERDILFKRFFFFLVFGFSGN